MHCSVALSLRDAQQTLKLSGMEVGAYPPPCRDGRARGGAIDLRSASALNRLQDLK